MNDFLFAFHEKEAKYKQIYEQMKQLIEKGQLQVNEPIPSIRKLAETLNVSRNTTLTAYEQLEAEGYIRGESKKGYYVNAYEPIYLQQDRIQQQNLKTLEPEILIDFRAGAVSKPDFPLKTWRKFANDTLQLSNVYTYGHRQGDPLLRQQLSRYLLQSRGVGAEPDDILIGSSTQQMLLYLSLLLKEEHDAILLEDPGYNGAREVFSMQQFTIEPILVTEDGMQLDMLHDQQARLIYVTPSHHFPFGVSMPIQQRQKLLHWAAKVDGYIIEDDYDSEFRYNQQPFPALASIDKQRVIYMGTFSKSFLPAIRLSYAVLPEPLLSRYNQQFASFEQNASTLHQLTMARFMEAGEWDRHIRKMRLTYKRKMTVLVKVLEEQFGSTITIFGTQSGLYVLVRVHTTQSEQWLIDQAANRGIKVYPTSPYYISASPSEPMIQIGISNLTHEEIEIGVRCLKEAWG